MRNNVEINAVGNFEPGEYSHVEINGIGKCSGPFTAKVLEVNGVLKAQGAVRADNGEVNGALECAGRLDAGELEINGAVKVEGAAGVEDLTVDGALTVEGDKLECGRVECDGAIKVNGGGMTASTIEVDGALNAKGDVSADSITVDGCLKTEGQVSADRIHVEGTISAAEIVGDEVIIWNQNRGFTGLGFTVTVGGKKFSFGSDSGRGHSDRVSQIGLIEATTIALEGVAAQTVNGTDVTIGPGCVIENLDCNGILRLDEAAQVGNITGNYTMAD